MIDQILTTHSMIVKIFLGFLVLSMLIPKMTEKNPLGFRKASFIYTMVFQGIITMIAFTGIIGMVLGSLPFSMAIMLMIAIWVVMMYIEIRKYKLIKVAQIEKPEVHALLKSGFIKINMAQILLVAVMVVFMILKSKGIITI
ncbi:hypothetical protein MNB_SV-5-980 [hydrothermal vent metagenome]|uniref:DUF4149 domain-containing protein n=1 Tax=hydrothermal vent metagenome TaxID=652676 RepID=A0A1W1EGB6_9ZZZZ